MPASAKAAAKAPSRASVCVYCGSRFGADPAYRADAQTLGAKLAENGWRLVYGAGDVGLMGAVARAAQEAGGDTFGVIPVHLLEREVGKRDLSAFVVTENMHERKKVMYMNSDAIVVLPGGAGSARRVFRGAHLAPARPARKADLPARIRDRYWDPLIALLDHVIDQGFAEESSLKGYVSVVSDVETLADSLRADLC